MSNGMRQLYEFGDFQLDAERHRLRHNQSVVPLSPKAIETLLAFVQNPGRPLEREELMQTVWAGAFVEDANLTVAISQLRKALGEYAGLIETIPRVGYRFAGEVRTLEVPSTPLILEKRTLSRTIVEEEITNNRVSDDRAIQGKTILVTALLTVIVTASVIYWKAERAPILPASGSQVKSMAILPLKTLRSNPEDEYLGLGLADALITQIGMMREIAIRPLSAVRKYDGQNQDPLEVGRALGVEAVLEGSVQHEGDVLRVTMRLLRVADGVVLWSGKFDQELTDFFSVQDSISQQVAQASVLTLSAEQRDRLTKKYTGSFEAYQLYLKGRYFWNKRTAAGLEQSIDFFNQAIKIDPAFSLAYAGLADAYALGVWQDSLQQKVYIPLAKAAATRALEIDESMGEAHASLGFIKFWYEWDFKGAEVSFLRAIELRPNHATAHHWFGECLALMGRSEQGIRELELALKADPSSAIIHSDLGKVLYFDGQFDPAIESLKRAVALDPIFPVSNLFLAMAYQRKGMREEAIKALEQEAKIESGRSVSKFVRAYVYTQVGRTEEAQRILVELQKPKSDRFTPAYGIALIHVGLGEKEKALTWLEKSKVAHEPFLAYLKADINFAPLHDDSRYAQILQEIGF